METQQSDRQPNFWERNAIVLKLLTIGFLSLLLLIPSLMIQNLVIERSETRDNAVKDIYSKWGEQQTIAGPILNIPYRVFTKNKDGKVEESIEYMHFLPEQLKINGSLNPSVRYRGIYEAILYNGKLDISGSFIALDLAGLKVNPESVLWNDAFFTIGVSDLRGIKEAVKFNIKEKQLTVNPGINVGGVFDSGLSIPLPASDPALYQNPIEFSFKLDINGSSRINFWPLGKESIVSLSSPWTTPSFSGAFLPEKREINEKGFEATWKVLELNRNFPQKWTGHQYTFQSADDHQLAYETTQTEVVSPSQKTSFEFGVDLLMPVDFYQKVHRSAKYAFMFIGLTFTAFFFIELVNKKRIHPVQYILVGVALVIFYTLLLSITEHVAFGWAYLISSGATILLITLFSGSVLQSKGLAILMFSLLSALYLFLYILLQMEDYALLIGSIGLFVILGIVMYISRKVEWYDFRKKELN